MDTNKRLQKAAQAIFQAGIDAVDPYLAVCNAISFADNQITVRSGHGKSVAYDIRKYDKIIAVGAGKASARMCKALEDILGDKLSSGLIVVKYGYTTPLNKVTMFEASHPVPDENGLLATREILALLDSLNERTLVFALISGGGSALLVHPAPGISLKDKQQLTNLLLSAGASINEMNAVRKHISAIKGGGLVKHAYPATVVSLILSDVVGDCLDTIASGPTVGDSTTFKDTKHILEKYALWEKTPDPIIVHLLDGCKGKIPETSKPKDVIFVNCNNVIIANNFMCLQACLAYAQKQGWNSLLLSSSIEGETRDIARMHAAIATEIRKSSNPINPPACIVSGGETTVTIQGKGMGGRNQEFALASAFDIFGQEHIAIFSAGTDGSDGPTNAAGAIAFGNTLTRGKNMGIDATRALAHNDSYCFFEKIGDLIKTGPTNTNVMDVHLILVE